LFILNSKVLLGCDWLPAGLFVWASWELLGLAFEPFKSQKAPGSQKPEAHYNELLGFWLMGAVWLLESPKASSLKVAKSSNKQGDAQQYENPRRKCEPLPSAA